MWNAELNCGIYLLLFYGINLIGMQMQLYYNIILRYKNNIFTYILPDMCSCYVNVCAYYVSVHEYVSVGLYMIAERDKKFQFRAKKFWEQNCSLNSF